MTNIDLIIILMAVYSYSAIWNTVISLIKLLLMDYLAVSNYFANINNTMMNIMDIYLWELTQLVPVVDFSLSPFPIEVILGGRISPTSYAWYWLMGLKDSKPQLSSGPLSI